MDPTVLSRRSWEMMSPRGDTDAKLGPATFRKWDEKVDVNALREAGLTYELAIEGALANGVLRLPPPVRRALHEQARRAEPQRPYARGVAAYFAVMTEVARGDLDPEANTGGPERPASRTQTLVQLNDDLVRRLDAYASRNKRSRSAIIRDLLEEALADERRDEISRRLIAGYTREPQSEGRDAWGDLAAWTESNTRRNLAGLGAEEDEGW